MGIWTLQTGDAGLQWVGWGYTLVQQYTLPEIWDDEGIVPYGFYWEFSEYPGDCHASDVGHWFAMTTTFDSAN